MKILYLALLCLGSISCSAFQPHGHWQASLAAAARPINKYHRSSKSLQRLATDDDAVAAAGRDAVVSVLPEEDVSFLWKKFAPTITIGATGFQPSHASLLNEFVKAHGCIKLKFSTDKLDCAGILEGICSSEHVAFPDLTPLRVANRLALLGSRSVLRKLQQQRLQRQRAKQAAANG